MEVPRWPSAMGHACAHHARNETGSPRHLVGGSGELAGGNARGQGRVKLGS
jgi:hypothetical protein